jgi:Zn-dependent M28 family amino/carboxypeptidase
VHVIVAFAGVFLLAGLLLAGLAALVVQPFVRPVPSRPAAVELQALQAHVRQLSVDLYPRSFDRPDHLEGAAAYIEAHFRASGGMVATQPVRVGGREYRNVIVRFGPDAGPVLVIGAHYDSHGVTPGADDNASGVAGLLELARLLGSTAPAQPVELVAYTLEEPPYFRTEHMGSAWHAGALQASGRQVRLMLSLEMIGYFADAPGSQSYPFRLMSLVYPPAGDFIAVVGRFGDFGLTRRLKAIMKGASALPVHSMNAPPVVPGVDFSDHLNYWSRGYPALMVTDTAFMRNPHYHRISDTPEKLDYQRLAQVVQGVYAVAQRF